MIEGAEDMVQIGDKKTIYGFFDNGLEEIHTTCVGFMPSGTPVWYTSMIRRPSFEIMDLYVAFDGVGMHLGYYETPEEVFECMLGKADLNRVQADHLITRVEEARVKWEERKDDN
ncbi:MAG: hypothetical protein V3T23_01750 [Nitrososphaerales archaeon]